MGPKSCDQMSGYDIDNPLPDEAWQYSFLDSDTPRSHTRLGVATARQIPKILRAEFTCEWLLKL